jgi:hypothetical protein
MNLYQRSGAVGTFTEDAFRALLGLFAAFRLVVTYQRVLLPVSVAFSYSGREGTTVGRGATELVASRPEVAVAKAWTGSTIMMKAA